MSVGQDVIDVAETQIGVTESPAGSNRTIYGRAYGFDGVSWCAMFVTWCYEQAGYLLPGDVESGAIQPGDSHGFRDCESALFWARAHGQLVEVPQAGDIVLFNWPGSRWQADHTGLVKSFDGGQLVTIEGNAQPLSALIVTPRGLVRMGDLCLGQWVTGPSGYPSKVTGIFPKGVQPIYRITLRDGTSTTATADHLWKVRLTQSRPDWQVLSTADLAALISAGKVPVLPFTAPVEWIVEDELRLDPYVLGCLIGDGGFTGVDVKFTNVDSALVDRVNGLLPGDDRLVRFERSASGNYTVMTPAKEVEQEGRTVTTFRQKRITHIWPDTDTERMCGICMALQPWSEFFCYKGLHVRRCRTCIATYKLALYHEKRGGPPVPDELRYVKPAPVEEVRYVTVARYPKRRPLRGRRSGLHSATNRIIGELGLKDHGASTKFIPEMYLRAGVKDRIALLQGLMDTDGTIDSQGRMEFTSASERLANDVRFLIMSLGGRASLNVKTQVYYTAPNQLERKKALPAWRVQNISFPPNSPVVPFQMEKKVRRLKERTQHRFWSIASIELIGEAEVQCISVSDPSHLYITDDFIPTHNTSSQGSNGSQDNGGTVALRTNRPLSQVCGFWRPTVTGPGGLIRAAVDEEEVDVTPEENDMINRANDLSNLLMRMVDPSFITGVANQGSGFLATTRLLDAQTAQIQAAVDQAINELVGKSPSTIDRDALSKAVVTEIADRFAQEARR